MAEFCVIPYFKRINWRIVLKKFIKLDDAQNVTHLTRIVKAYFMLQNFVPMFYFKRIDWHEN